MHNVIIEYAEKLHPIFTKPKRIKIIVGGRGSTKSTGIAGHAIGCLASGQLWCCAREQLNSIEESVHRTILSEIDRVQMPGFTDTKTSIKHVSGGRCFYRGLSRNITSLKSTLTGVDVLWIEEGEDLSDNSLRVLTASVRRDAAATQKAIAGEDVKMPEIIITMNRGSENDPISKKWLSRAEKELERCGYYEDDLLMIVEINYTDMPEDWFIHSGLEQERLDDYERMSRAQYDHKWHGKYLEMVDNSIILPEWFDAAVDAHIKLGFKPTGAKVAAFDPSDMGPDSKGFVLRHGSVITHADEMLSGDVNEGCDWATGLAIQLDADIFTWDCDGMGVTLKRDVAKAFEGKHVDVVMFNGSSGVDEPDSPVIATGAYNTFEQSRTNADTYFNKRAQYYCRLADRMYNTYRAVVKGVYINPDDMISFCSNINVLSRLKSELCRIPRIPNGNGKVQLMSKKDMKSKYQIESPNLGDPAMMSLVTPPVKAEYKKVKVNTRRVI